MSRGGLGRNAPCFCGSGKKYKKCCYPRTLPDLAHPNAGLPKPHEEQAAIRRAISRRESCPPPDRKPTIDTVDVGRTRLRCAPLAPYGDRVALPGTMAPPTPLQVETKYQEIRESNPDRVTEVVVTYTYPEPSGFAEARMVFEADEHFLLVDGQVVSVLDLFRGMQVRMADGTIGTIIGNPERRYEIPIPPLPTENGLWNSRVVGRVRHTADEMVEFRWAGQMVRVTPGHVVWSVTRQGWVGAQELFQGELIRVAGSLVAPVEGAKRITGRVEVFGIEVEYFHNYFVGTGDNAMLVHNGPDCVVKPVDPLEAWENEGGALSPSAVKEAKLARLFADVEPVEVTGRVNLEGRTPQEIGQMLPRFTTIQQEGSNPAFGLLVDNRTGRVFALRSGLSPQVQETVNGIPYKTGTMTRATAEAAGGIWGDPRRPSAPTLRDRLLLSCERKGLRTQHCISTAPLLVWVREVALTIFQLCWLRDPP